MFKFGITLILIVGLAVSTEQAFRKFKNVDCENLPDFTFNKTKKHDPCAIEAKIEPLIQNFTVADQEVVRNLLGELKDEFEDLFCESFGQVRNNRSELFTELATKDNNGYAALEQLIESAETNEDYTCQEGVTALENFHNSLNTEGKAIMKKVMCYTMKLVKKGSRAVVRDFYLENKETIDRLSKDNAQASRNLMRMIRKMIRKMRK